MENGRLTGTDSASEKKADISDALTKSPRLARMVKSASQNSPTTTTATMPKGSPKTWTSAELAELRRKAGLVAGALADFQAAGGVIVRKKVEYTLPSGSRYEALKFHLIIEGASLVAVETPDGIDFDVVAATSLPVVSPDEAHQGDPCVKCGKAHDAVEVGACTAQAVGRKSEG